MKIVAIIQARMGSSRLPHKVLSDIAGRTMIDRIIERVAAASLIDEIVVATSLSKDDDVLVEHLLASGAAHVFRGSMDDVLSRYYESARLHGATHIVRITADDPLKDPQIIDRAVRLLLDDTSLDYCSNTITPTFPEGLDVEAFTFAALETAHREAQLPSEREHVTPYIWKNSALFKALNFTHDTALQDWRWTVDKPQDLEFMQHVYTQFQDQPLVPYQAVIKWLESNPHIRLLNADTIRNEGYFKSLKSEEK